MTVYGRLLLAGLGSAALLVAALGSQWLGGLAPCPLCIWQRWPHAAAVVIAALAVTVLWRVHRALAALGGAAMLTGAGLGVYHTGIERGWWPGPDTCAAPDAGALSTDELYARLLETEIVRCDEVAWTFLGLSMASWNAVISLGLATLWFWCARKPQPAP